MSTDIQRARDILAKWREDTYPGKWSWRVREDRHWDVLEAPEYDDPDKSIGLIGSDEAARLIVGTAGNPDLLDAIDGLLDYTMQFDAAGIPRGSIGDDAERIAAAIIAAVERMTS